MACQFRAFIGERESAIEREFARLSCCPSFGQGERVNLGRLSVESARARASADLNASVADDCGKAGVSISGV